MTLDLESFTKLKKRVDNAQRDQDKAIGAMSILTDRLSKEFGVSTKEEGEAKLDRWRKKLEISEKELWKEISDIESQFKQDWPEKE